ncbi:hypothetical protein BC939DRAFT_480251 [Gamsiella multidivaricata]|uniref:uncharacterized protein n=1 Tax=Gamsiella multidivaricata TaxID=101098 RepID=UPI00221F8BAC|nr:uncharacterized protein BC939DRAFT_480251 [Gamsiella multidivaricata]KAI7818586.1 hypothetical protein BC939DRAFT_480251 [Gamsiella multidivaricata]
MELSMSITRISVEDTAAGASTPSGSSSGSGAGAVVCALLAGDNEGEDAGGWGELNARRRRCAFELKGSSPNETVVAAAVEEYFRVRTSSVLPCANANPTARGRRCVCVWLKDLSRFWFTICTFGGRAITRLPQGSGKQSLLPVLAKGAVLLQAHTSDGGIPAEEDEWLHRHTLHCEFSLLRSCWFMSTAFWS